MAKNQIDKTVPKVKTVNLDNLSSEELGLLLSEQYGVLMSVQQNIRNVTQALEARRPKE